MSAELLEMEEDDRFLIFQAFQGPRGKYPAERAAQLSGVPERTVYHWAKEGFLKPDFDEDRPKMWSYRDLVYLRLFAWLRTKRHSPAHAASHVLRVRRRLEVDPPDPMLVRSDGHVVLLGDEQVDALSGQQLFSEVVAHLSTFDLLVPVGIDDLIRGRSLRLWGPNLVRPSLATRISPWVMGGEPCIDGTRLPTSTVFALHQQRGLSSSDIAHLYPDVAPHQVTDALELERRLRRDVLAA